MTAADLATVNRLIAEQSTTAALDMRKRCCARLRELAGAATSAAEREALRDAAVKLEELQAVGP